ncbi:hypothetical protein KQX54_012540 [Cotesia glomerata]|uniref:Uncharacterized protein n=1 Tax=Cotesia glomerata TaxID=32391 RepID=A0AAV7J3J4_COTGL|nr:hypothetical protein KQX54_012540 [Cotesia glomerata]
MAKRDSWCHKWDSPREKFKYKDDWIGSIAQQFKEKKLLSQEEKMTGNQVTGTVQIWHKKCLTKKICENKFLELVFGTSSNYRYSDKRQKKSKTENKGKDEGVRGQAKMEDGGKMNKAEDSCCYWLIQMVESFNEDQHYQDRISEFVRRKNLGYDITTTTSTTTSTTTTTPTPTTTMSYKDETTTKSSESIGTKMNSTKIDSSFVKTTENSNEPHHQKCSPSDQLCLISLDNCCTGYKCTKFERLPKNIGFCYTLPKYDVINPFAEQIEKAAVKLVEMSLNNNVIRVDNKKGLNEKEKPDESRTTVRNVEWFVRQESIGSPIGWG